MHLSDSFPSFIRSDETREWESWEVDGQVRTYLWGYGYMIGEIRHGKDGSRRVYTARMVMPASKRRHQFNRLKEAESWIETMFTAWVLTTGKDPKNLHLREVLIATLPEEIETQSEH